MSQRCSSATLNYAPNATDLTDAQWVVLEPLLLPPGKPGPKHADLREVVNGLLYVSHTGCQWRFLPGEYGPWTRVWSQFRRWSRNGTWTRVLAALHELARIRLGRKDSTPSLVVLDTSLARGSSRGGLTFHDKGGPYGATNGAKRVVAVDVTGLPLAAMVVPASTHESKANELLLARLAAAGQDSRLEVALVDKGTAKVSTARLSRLFGIEVRQVGWPRAPKGTPKVFKPIAHAWRVEVAHGRLGWRSRSRTRPRRRQGGWNWRVSRTCLPRPHSPSAVGGYRPARTVAGIAHPIERNTHDRICGNCDGCLTGTARP